MQSQTQASDAYPTAERTDIMSKALLPNGTLKCYIKRFLFKKTL